MTESPPSLVPGTLVGNRFRLEKLLGKGAMGTVWSAWHTTLHVQVAVKFIEGTLANRPDLVSRFALEAQAVAKIDSRNIVRVLDFGTTESGRPYIAMELLDGEPLANRLDRDIRLSIDLTARVVVQAAKGLSKAHAQGIIHRDVKPDNMFICDDDEDGPRIKILDFGIAKTTAIEGSAHKTGTGLLLGTPHYMSPEQALGNKTIDVRSDLYSLAVVAYRCLTGQVPFDSEGLGALIVQIINMAHPKPSVICPDLGKAFDPWFDKALAKEPEERYATARELGEGFLEACTKAQAGKAEGQYRSNAPGRWDETTETKNVQIPAPAAKSPNVGAEPTKRPRPHLILVSIPPPWEEQATLEGATSTHPEPIAAPAPRSVPRWAIGLVLATTLAGGAYWFLSQSANPSDPAAAASAPVEGASAPALPNPVPVDFGTTSPTEPVGSAADQQDRKSVPPPAATRPPVPVPTKNAKPRKVTQPSATAPAPPPPSQSAAPLQPPSEPSAPVSEPPATDPAKPPEPPATAAPPEPPEPAEPPPPPPPPPRPAKPGPAIPDAL